MSGTIQFQALLAMACMKLSELAQCMSHLNACNSLRACKPWLAEVRSTIACMHTSLNHDIPVPSITQCTFWSATLLGSGLQRSASTSLFHSLPHNFYPNITTRCPLLFAHQPTQFVPKRTRIEPSEVMQPLPCPTHPHCQHCPKPASSLLLSKTSQGTLFHS
jgi:hypothetical protein